VPPAVAACMLSFAVAAAGPAGATSTAAGLPAVAAPGGPGTMSYFDLARKDCLGTARNTTSKVWYTVAGGVLSDVYEPTIDNTDVQTLQYIVTDGSTFTDLQTRDMTYTVAADPSGMACTVTATSASHGYKLVTTYITDPARDTVLMDTRLDATPGSHTAISKLRLYARLDAHVNGDGGGGTPNAGGNAGTASDGLPQLAATHTLTSYDSAPNGHVTATEDVTPRRGDEVTLALGFGRTQAQAVATAGASLARPLRLTELAYLAGWAGYDLTLRRPPSSFPGLSGAQASVLQRRYYLSANVIKSSEDKTFPGAIVASMASPWGQAVAAGTAVNGKPVYYGSYREVFSRDLYQAFTGLLTDGDIATARAATLFLFNHQQLRNGQLPRNSLVNGAAAPDTGGNQLDETAYPILMALQAGLAGDATLWQQHIRPAADSLVAMGPS